MAAKKKKNTSSISQALIRNYGLFWKLEDTFLGRGRNAGHLKGTPANALTSDPVDFRDQVGIYVLYSDYKIVYIGQAGYGNRKLFDRLKQHTRDNLANRWNQFSWFGLRYALKSNVLSVVPDKLNPSKNTLLNHIEAILIHAGEPPLNRQGGKWGKNVKHYLQYRDAENLGPTITEALHKIYEAYRD